MSSPPETRTPGVESRDCERCGGPIGAARIEALPRTRTCIVCARSGAQRPSRGQMCR